MSQKAQQDQDRRRAPTQNVKTQGAPIVGLSPDDDVGVVPPGTGQPGQGGTGQPDQDGTGHSG